MALIAQFGPYAPYILSAYAAAGLILGGLVVASLVKASKARSRLAALEARGLTLRD